MSKDTVENKDDGWIVINARGKPYKLHFSINALCILEAEIEKIMPAGDKVDVQAIMQGRPSIGMIRTLFWAALQQHHRGMTKDEAGDVMEALGMQGAAEAVARAFSRAFGSGVLEEQMRKDEEARGKANGHAPLADGASAAPPAAG